MLDLEDYNQKRKAKYSVRNIFKQLDLQKSHTISLDIFLVVLSDNGIHLLESDQQVIQQQAHKYNRRVSYLDVIKDLTLVAFKGENSHDLSNLSKNAKIRKMNKGLMKTQENLTEKSENNTDAIISGFSEDLQQVVNKIIGKTQLQYKPLNGKIDWSKHQSAASKTLNIPKNIQTKIFIKAALSSHEILSRKERIRRYMKENNVDIMHLNAMNSVFLDCDTERQGYIPKKDFLLQIADQNLQFPWGFLEKLMEDMQIEAEDKSEHAKLSYEKLKNIMEIYNNCPTFLKGDNNNSDNFRQNMLINIEQSDNLDRKRADKLFQYVHARIEEKFKDFRHAFRSFDKNFDGGLNFKEFITGMESVGVKLKLSDYRLLFDYVDYDSQGEIGFSKFCLFNIDRKQDLLNLKAQYQSNASERENSKSLLIKGTKPPKAPSSIAGSESNKAHPLFGDGNIPKNKDANGFTLAIQAVTHVQSYMQKRFLRTAHSQGFRTSKDFPEEHTFGLKQERDHNMLALLTNSYQDDLKRVTLESLRQQLTPKARMPPRPTNSQIIRDRMVRSKLNTSGSASLISQGAFIPTPKRIRRQDFILRGSNALEQKSIQLNRSHSLTNK